MAWPWNLGYVSFKVIENGTFVSLGTVSYSQSIVTMALSCIISEIKPDISRKLQFFSIPSTHLHSTPSLGGPCRNIAARFGMEIVEWRSYTRRWKRFTIYLAVSTEYRRVSDILLRHSQHNVQHREVESYFSVHNLQQWRCFEDDN